MKKKISIFLLSFIMLFNIYQVDYNTRKIEINKPVEALEPLTIMAISSALIGLSLSLGFQLVNSTSDSFTQGCMTLYNNFTTNTKALVDRVASRFQNGDSTYDVTPDELEAFGNDLKNVIESSVSENNGVTVISVPAYSFNDAFGYEVKTVSFEQYRYHEYFVSQGFNYNDYYNLRLYNNDLLIFDRSYTEYLNDNGSTWWRINDNISQSQFANGSVPVSFPYPSIDYYSNGGNNYFTIRFAGSNSKFYSKDGFNPQNFRLEIGNEVVQEPPVIAVGQMNISELISALKSSGALNSQGAVTQQFITNYDTAVPSDIYTDTKAKTVVDTLYDGADTNVPDVPADWTILQSMYQVLRDIYSNVKTGISTISNTLSQLLSNVKAIPQTISTALTSLFVPPQGFINVLVTDFQNSMSNKFGDRKIDLTSFASSRVPEDIEINIMGQTVKVFESQMLIDFVDAVRSWIIGFIGILAIFYNFNNVYRLFSGAEYVGSTGSSQLSTQSMLQSGSNDFLRLGGGK